MGRKEVIAEAGKEGIYWLVAKSSQVMKVIAAHEQRYRGFQDAVHAFKKKHGAESVFTYGPRSLAGLGFKGDPPKGWRLQEDRCAVPDGRCKEGRAFRQEMKALPSGFDAWSFSEDLGSDYISWEDGRVFFSTFQKFGERYILYTPSGCKVKPAGCRKLKMSEYWKIRETKGTKQ